MRFKKAYVVQLPAATRGVRLSRSSHVEQFGVVGLVELPGLDALPTTTAVSAASYFGGG